MCAATASHFFDLSTWGEAVPVVVCYMAEDHEASSSSKDGTPRGLRRALAAECPIVARRLCVGVHAVPCAKFLGDDRLWINGATYSAIQIVQACATNESLIVMVLSWCL